MERLEILSFVREPATRRRQFTLSTYGDDPIRSARVLHAVAWCGHRVGVVTLDVQKTTMLIGGLFEGFTV